VIRRVLLFSFLFSSIAAVAQVAPSANGGYAALWVGGEYSSYNPDYGPRRIEGAGAYVDFNLTRKIGAVGEARWMDWGGIGGQNERDYLAGGKYRFYQWHKFSLNGKVLAGGVWITFPNGVGSGSYFAFAPGGFVDYRVSRRFSIRGDYEYQFIRSAPNIPFEPNNGMTPDGFSVGVAYRILGVR
jgi:hypothetical protein